MNTTAIAEYIEKTPIWRPVIMNLQEIQSQILKLPTQDKWELVQTLLNAIKKDTTDLKKNSKKTYPLRGLPITISEDFDDPMPELWEVLTE
ncbi:hypothetical protein [Synechocystis sp. LEGE 06083]|uniref:hypothetical protein n=1 Tax=Synechocystis sp. LEGE 06083 TaxID=915336 RepID=UPI001D13EFB3|nr:hypothetical protein [Synechocystis sp. LEGE 06083]